MASGNSVEFPSVILKDFDKLLSSQCHRAINSFSLADNIIIRKLRIVNGSWKRMHTTI